MNIHKYYFLFKGFGVVTEFLVYRAGIVIMFQAVLIPHIKMHSGYHIYVYHEIRYQILWALHSSSL
jgi:hypothetical protein